MGPHRSTVVVHRHDCEPKVFVSRLDNDVLALLQGSRGLLLPNGQIGMDAGCEVPEGYVLAVLQMEGQVAQECLNSGWGILRFIGRVGQPELGSTTCCLL